MQLGVIAWADGPVVSKAPPHTVRPGSPHHTLRSINTSYPESLTCAAVVVVRWTRAEWNVVIDNAYNSAERCVSNTHTHTTNFVVHPTTPPHHGVICGSGYISSLVPDVQSSCAHQSSSCSEPNHTTHPRRLTCYEVAWFHYSRYTVTSCGIARLHSDDRWLTVMS